MFLPGYKVFLLLIPPFLSYTLCLYGTFNRYLLLTMLCAFMSWSTDRARGLLLHHENGGRHERAAGCDWEWLNRVSVEWPPNDFSFSFEIHYVLVYVNYNHFVLFVHRRVGDCSATLIPVQYLICCSLVAAKSQCSYLLFVSWMFRQQEVCSSCFSSFKLSKMQRQYFLCSPILGCADR